MCFNFKKQPMIAGDGITDDTAAIQSAIDSGKGLDLGYGNFLISKGLVINKDNFTLKGIGRNTATQLVCNENFDAITINGMRCMVDGVV